MSKQSLSKDSLNTLSSLHCVLDTISSLHCVLDMLSDVHVALDLLFSFHCVLGGFPGFLFVLLSLLESCCCFSLLA